MSINLLDVTATGGLSMSPEIFSGSIQSTTYPQHLQVNPASTLFNLVGDFTIEAWVYPTSSTGWGIFDARTSGGSASPWLFALADQGSGYVILFFDGSYYYGTNIVPLNAWSHIAIVRTGSTLTYYLNGEVDTTISYTSSPISPGSTTPFVGASKDNTPFPGNISNLRIVVGVAVYTSAFTPSTSPLTVVQPANLNGSPSSAITGNQTVLLLNTPNNGFNVRDSSNNNFVLLNTGMPVASGLNPFFPTSGISFNGNGEYLTAPSDTVYEFGTGDFTVEGWYNFNSFDLDNALILLGTGAIGGANYSAWWLRYYIGSGGPFLQLYRYAGSYEENYTFSLGSYLNTNQWYHIACARNGTDLRMFLNGTQVDITQTCATDYTIVNSDPLQIGKVITGNGTFYLDGYISNIRVVKGIAVYTSNFTPSNHSLTSTQSANVNGNPSAAITGTETSLLLTTPYNINYLADSSSYDFTITKFGSPSPASINGSSTFNYSNLIVPSSSYGSLFDQDGAFTIECWYYPTNLSDYGYASIWTMNAQFWDCNYDSSPSGATAGKFIFNNPYIGNIVTTDTFATYNTWYHIALSSDGTTTRAFINGTLQGTFSGNGVVQTSGNPLQIGLAFNGPYGYNLVGNLSNFRMVKGVGVYTSAFTPSTNPLTTIQAANVNGSPSAAIAGYQTVLLLSTPNNILNYLDSSVYQLLTTDPNTPVPSAWSPYNLGSISFHDACYLQISESTIFNFDVNDFTIETWAYWSTAKTGNETIFEGNYGTRLIFGISATGVRLLTDTVENGCTYSFSVDTWYHIAVVRLSGNISIYVNGTLANTPFADSIAWAFTTETIGRNSDGFESYTGEISNLRVVNGVAVYTDTFTVPTQPLSVSQPSGTNINSVVPEQTVLLLNSPDSPNNLLDTSIYNLTVTPAGTPTAIVNNPFGPL